MIVAFLSCSTPLSQVEKVQVFEQVQLNPETSITECAKFTDVYDSQECLSIGAHALTNNPVLKRTLCEQLTDSHKAECYFELAEEFNNINDCDAAEQYKLDCQSHILQRQCGQYKQLSDIQQYITKHGIDFTNGIEGLMYRCILDKKPYVPIEQCKSAPNVSKCESVAAEIYQLHLNSKPFNCTRLPRHSRTSNHPTLENLLARHQTLHCPDQD